jgi:predicted dinucleotide-binding enzyme
MEVLLMTTRIGVIGSGVVGQVLAAGFAKHGFETMIGSRTPENLAEWAAGTSPSVATGTVEETANHADLVVLAVKGTAAGEAARLAGHALAGKTVIDATNPIADAPPEGGVLKFFTSLDESLMEKLQAATPEARFVKAFSCVGNALMINPDLPGGPPTMFICGNDADAKAEVTAILDTFGWETEDMGGAETARAIEPLCILWCIPGFQNNQWMHAFKLLKQ